MSTQVYGCRDDDDESVGSHRRSKIFQAPRQLKKLGNPKKKLGRVLNDTRTLLKGANLSNHLGHLYGMGDSDGEDDDSESSYESESSSDEGSVSSTSKMTKRFSQSFQKLGDSFRGAVHLGRKGEDHHDDSSPLDRSISILPKEELSDSDSNSDSDDDSDDSDDRSVASFAKVAAKSVKRRMSKALKVAGRRRSGKKQEEEDSDDESVEEDLFQDSFQLPGMMGRSKSFVEESTSSKANNRRSNPFSKSLTSGGPTKSKPRRHTSLDGARDVGRLYNRGCNDDDDLSDLSGDEAPPQKQSNKPPAYSNNWSMNVTPEILEASMKGGFEGMNMSRNYLEVGEDHTNPAGMAA